jgi:uncharacterized SAM-binding protein YcdF (DUF218 family)
MIGKAIRTVLQTIGLLTVLALFGGIFALFLLGPWLQYQDQPERSDYIIPLAGDGHRLIKAAELYREGFAPKILLSNEQVRELTRYQKLAIELGYPRPEPEAFRLQLLERLGVPSSATETFGQGHISTVEEAEALKRFLGDRSGTMILVTSPFQARRAKMIFERVMPQCRWLIVWPPERSLPERWWSDQRAALDTVTEIAKLLYYWAGGAFRANAQQN